MKASELRIGNLIEDFSGRILTVDGVFRDEEYKGMCFIQVRENGSKYIPDDLSIKAIPLTPEWLERAGFEKGTVMANGNTEYYIQEVGKFCGIITFDFYVWQIDGDFFVEMEWEGYCTKIKIPVKCVHQLQNLYFALTGKELEFKPENVKG